MNLKICHMTSVHRSNDTRILHKECVSLANEGYEVYLVAKGNSYVSNGVHVIGVEQTYKNKFARVFKFAREIYKKALNLNADIYHIHDPELLPYALKLKKKGKKVIFDSHEDYLSTFDDKSWLPKVIRPLVKTAYDFYEKYVCSKLDAIIVCYHWTEDRMKKINNNVEMILNFPIVDNNNLPDIDYSSRTVSFAGSISHIWCHEEVLESLTRIKDVKYKLAGRLEGEYKNKLEEKEGWKLVDYHGLLSLDEVYNKIYAKSSIGLALLDYIPACKRTIGNLSNTKFFEYMYIGLPLICTDFTLWRKIVEEENCGICVNPHDISEITKAIEFLINNPLIAKKMGENGKKAILMKYNWEMEEQKLIRLYTKIR